MSKLIFIRHSITQKDSNVFSGEWRLSHAGREACKSLAEKLKAHGLTRLIASMEPKAIETARLTAEHLGLLSEIVAGLQEHDRSNVPYLPTQERFNETVRDLFTRPDERVFGMETANQALARFAEGVFNLVERSPEETLGIVTHGTVLSLFLAQHNDIDIYDFWQTLGMPAFVVVSLPGFEIIEIENDV